MVNYKERSKYGIRSHRELIEANCAEDSLRVLSATWFAEAMIKGGHQIV